MNSGKKIAVIYLMWFPAGFEKFRDFIHSYVSFNAGAEHELIIVFKDSNDPEADWEQYDELLKHKRIIYKRVLQNGGMDIHTYFSVAKNIATEYLFFLNTSSVFLADNWLLKYASRILDNHNIIISATGSWRSHFSNVFQKFSLKWEPEKGWVYNYRKYKLFIKAIFYWRLLFKPFPNPHLRTNAFLIHRQTFLQADPGPVRTKFKAFQFESGRRSLTNFYLANGYKVFVIDKAGKVYKPSEWYLSKTFWINGQEGLLVSDNQTRIYDDASPEQKKAMTRSVWGKSL